MTVSRGTIGYGDDPFKGEDAARPWVVISTTEMPFHGDQYCRQSVPATISRLAASVMHSPPTDALVHEDLRSLSPPSDEDTLSWELSSWARGDIIENIEQSVPVSLLSGSIHRGRVGRVPGVAQPATPASHPTTSKNTGGAGTSGVTTHGVGSRATGTTSGH